MDASAAFEDAFDATAAGLAEAPPRALLDRQLARLDRLAEAGMEMVEALVAQAKGTGPKVVEGDVGLAFGRVSRAVRLCVLLHSELTKGLDDPQPAAPGRQAQVERAVRIVARVARDHCGKEPYEARAYAQEARERLDDDDIYGLVASRPVGELVAMVCDDLGLEPDWEHLAAEAWAQAEIDSGAKGSPFLEDDEGTPEEADAPEPGPARPEFRPPTFQETLMALARDPEILAAARRGSG